MNINVFIIINRPCLSLHLAHMGLQIDNLLTFFHIQYSVLLIANFCKPSQYISNHQCMIPTKSMLQRSTTQIECPICCQSHPPTHLHSISGNCSHKACLECCINHIEAKCQQFTSITCLEAKCKQVLHQQSHLYSLLSPPLQAKIQKYWSYVTISSDKNLKPCSVQQCLGAIRIDNKSRAKLTVECSHCKALHCNKCYLLQHEGQCVISKQQGVDVQAMNKLNYRKCPQCSTWLEKAGGCNYLTCKCGVEFCFDCGVEFEYDPCRKKQLLPITQEIQQKLAQFHFRKPQNALDYVGVVLKVIFVIPLLVVFVLLWSFLPFVAIAVMIPIIILLSPGLLITVYGEMGLQGKCKLFARVLTVLLYPVIGTIIATLCLMMVISYPVVRFTNYFRYCDSLDIAVSKLVHLYLIMSIKLLHL